MGSVLYVRMPAMGPAAAAANASLTSAAVASRPRTTARSVSDPSSTGTRTATPSSFPATAGMTSPVARAAPVVVGTMLVAGVGVDCGHEAAFHAEHDGQVDALARRRDQYLPGAALQVERGAVPSAELTGGLDHDVGAELAPVDLGRVPFGQHPDRDPVDAHRVGVWSTVRPRRP